MINTNSLDIHVQQRSIEQLAPAAEHRFLSRRHRIAFYYIYTAFTLGGATALLIPQGPGWRGSNFVFSLAWICMHALSFFVFVGFRRHQKYPFAFTAIVGGYIVASAIWSDSPFDSLVYGGMVAGNIAAAYMISRDLDISEILLMIARVVLFLAITGMIAAFLGFSQAIYFDRVGRTTIIGTQPMRGFFNHKVPAALYATIGALACLSCYRGMYRALAVSALGLFVVFTGSSTGLIIFPVALILYFGLSQICGIRKEGLAKAVAFFSIFLGGLAIVLLNEYMDVILAWLGRDPTLTGRTLLWEWGIKTWMQSPVIGLGFNGYFNGPEAHAISEEIKRFENYDVPHFHQSYIQTAVDLGVIGILILVFTQISIIVRSWTFMRRISANAGIALMAINIIMIIAATTMFLFITYNHFSTLSTFVMYFSLRRYFHSSSP